MLGGGYNGGSVNSVELFSPNGGCNYQLAPLPIQIYANFFLGRYKQMIFACFGFITQSGSDNNRCWQYFPNNDTWAFLTQSNYYHRWSPGVIHNNSAYFVDNGSPEKYNIETNQWSASFPAMTSRGEAACIVPYLDTFFLLGGTSYNIGNEQYNFTSRGRNYQISAQLSYSYFGCTLLPARTDKPLSSPLFSDTILIMQSVSSDVAGTLYDIKNDKFLPLSTTTYGHRHNFILNLGHRVFVFAGYNGAPNNIVEEHHQHNNSWTVLPTLMKFSRYHLSGLAVPADWFRHMPGGCLGVK
jgi:hypothetical protein